MQGGTASHLASLPPQSLQVSQKTGCQAWLPLQVKQGGSLLAAASEDGFVFVVNTAAPLPQGLGLDSLGRQPLALWEAHANAVFDLAWAQVRALPSKHGQCGQHSTDSAGHAACA